MEQLAKEIEEIKKKATQMIGNMSINNSETEIMKILIEISQTNGENTNYNKKTLEILDRYLVAKKQMLIIEEDVKFLHEIAKGLREQEIRITDSVTTPLFKIVNKYGDEKYFITRDSADKYIEMDKLNCRNKYNKIMELVSNENMELEKVLEIIKRNF